jgi:hypothetical protein
MRESKYFQFFDLFWREDFGVLFVDFLLCGNAWTPYQLRREVALCSDAKGATNASWISPDHPSV